MAHIETRQRILDAATEMFASCGYDGVSVRDIAAKAGVNIGAISYHFGGKENLLKAAVAEGLGAARQTVADINSESLPLDRKLEIVFGRFLEFLSGEYSISKIIIAELLLGGGRLPEIAGAHFTKLAGDMRSMIKQAVDAGEIRKTDETLLFISFASFPAYLVFAKPIVEIVRGEKGYSKAFIRKAARHHVRVLFDGIRKRSDED
ncbi:MAG TPA: TetR family transcriptional regulator [bacterium]|nr:TetR family transcriptional regulator [bacterium]